MAIRAGMTDVVRRLRHLGQAGMEDYTVVDEVYWSDEHIQDILDGNRQRVIAAPLRAEPEYVDGTDQYKRYVLDLDARRYGLEGTAGGTSVFRVMNSIGATITGYMFGEHDLSFTFATNQVGTAYYLNSYAYDMNGAARELWLLKAGHAWSAVNFAADGHRFDRSQLHDHCLTMAKVYEQADGISTVKMVRSDIQGPGEGEHF